MKEMEIISQVVMRTSGIGNTFPRLGMHYSGAIVAFREAGKGIVIHPAEKKGLENIGKFEDQLKDEDFIPFIGYVMVIDNSSKSTIKICKQEGSPHFYVQTSPYSTMFECSEKNMFDGAMSLVFGEDTVPSDKE